MTVDKARQWARKAGAGGRPKPCPGVSVDEIEFAATAGPLRARVYRPLLTRPRAVLVWFPGGAFILESLGGDSLLAPLARVAECVIVSVRYRLAPEHPFPAATQDADAAVCWVAEHARALCGRGAAVMVGGDSAGGNLAAVTALSARARGGPDIALQILVYPVISYCFDGPSRKDPAIGVLAPPAAIDWMWNVYLAGADPRDPKVSPLSAESLRELPPAVVVTAEYDALRDEGEAYAQRLELEGVAVHRRRYSGMPHGFAGWTGEVDAAGDCVDFLAECVRRYESPDSNQAAPAPYPRTRPSGHEQCRW